MHGIRYLYLCLLIQYGIPVASYCQELPVRHIPEVTVTKGNQEYYSEDQTVYKVDEEILRISKHQDLGYCIEKQTLALVRTYGSAGSLASVSIHGTASNHTQVNWNGFTLNSPTTGQADLALIPSGFMKSVELINGTSGAVYGSGTFGGSVNLSNEPDWENRFKANLSLDFGSFGSVGSMFALHTGSHKLQYQLSAMGSKAANDYSYHDPYMYGSPEMKMNHNAYQSVGLIQNLYANLGKGNYLDAGFWYQYKTLEIPALMGSYKENNARQKDSVFRTFASYRKITEKTALIVRSAYFSDYLGYTDKNSAADTFYSINSRLATNRWINQTEYRYYFTPGIVLGAGASFNRITANSGNYGGRIVDHEYALAGLLKVTLTDIIVNLGMRKEFYEGLNPGIQYSLGIRYKPNDHCIIRSGFSSKFRKPTFNEKYWKPGGNPLLQPERGRGGEITGEWFSSDRNEHHIKFNTSVTGYYQWVDNWIQWVSRDSLTPVEYKKVHIRGLDARVELGYNSSEVNINCWVNYNYNRSVVVSTYDHDALSEGKQLPYVPVHIVRTGLEARYTGLTLGISADCTGSRETVETADESLRLPGYAVLNLMAGIHREIAGVDLALFFQVDNIMDKSYEVIRAYPHPGRTLHFTFTMGFGKENSQN